MDIKCIVTDMDGTFLSKGNDYNRERFLNVYAKMKEAGIQFVVASGNQYDQISSFFEDEDILYAAENGAWIRHRDQELFCAEMDAAAVFKICDVLKRFAGVEFCICGKQRAYVDDARLLPVMSECFPTIQVIEDYHTIQDTIFKIAAVTPIEETDTILKEIEKILPDSMVAVNSGFGCIDINIKGIHKGSALDVICAYLAITYEECMVFGDSGNDLEMLEKAVYSYAMENASPAAKQAAHNHAPACCDEGVLQVIETLFL